MLHPSFAVLFHVFTHLLPHLSIPSFIPFIQLHFRWQASTPCSLRPRWDLFDGSHSKGLPGIPIKYQGNRGYAGQSRLHPRQKLPPTLLQLRPHTRRPRVLDTLLMMWDGAPISPHSVSFPLPLPSRYSLLPSFSLCFFGINIDTFFNSMNKYYHFCA